MVDMVGNNEAALLFDAMMTTSPDAIIVANAEGTITHVSRSAEILFRYDQGLMSGMNVRELMPASMAYQRDGFLLHDPTTGEAGIIAKGRVVVAMDALGEEFPIHLSLADECHNGHTRYFGFCHDLRVQQDIECDRERLQVIQNALFDAAADGVITIDAGGFIQSFNRAAEILFGWSATEVVGRNVTLLMPQEHARKHGGYLEHYLMGGEAKIIGKGRQLTGMKRDGSIFPMHLSVGDALFGDGRTFIGICHDLSTRHRLMAEVDEARREAEYVETHDALTGLLTKATLIENFHAWSDVNTHCAVVALSCVRFGRINQRYGFDVGDRILKWMAQRLQRFLPDVSLICRLSGSHFIAVIPGSDPEVIGHTVRKVVALMKGPYTSMAESVRLNARAGICLYPQDGDRISELIQWTEAAMLDVSAEMDISFYNSADHARLTRTMDIEQALRSALLNNQLEVYLQPKVRLQSGERIAFEALVRWPLADSTFISPAEFIPIAEAVGLGKELDRYMINKVVHYQATRRSAGRPVLPIAINITGPHFTDASLLNLVFQRLDLREILPCDLMLEITESSLITPDALVLEHLRQFRNRGIRIFIDDFGTGYSSLSYLKELPVHGIKIDKVFVDEVLTLRGSQMIAGILAIAGSQSLSVIAEGIEQTQQVEALMQLGCEIGQGYLFDRPFPMADAE